jgi:hypothetical protein
MIAREALDDEPSWALGAIQELLNEVNPTGEERDPFSTGFEVPDTFDSDEFLYLYASAHPEFAGDLIRESGEILASEGFEGWAAAMIEQGREEEVSSYIAQTPGEEQGWRQRALMALLVEANVERAHAMLGDGNTGLDLAMVLRIRREQGDEAAADWYMGRVSTPADRAERAATVAGRFPFAGFTDLVAWVEGMEREGVDTSSAYSSLIEVAGRNGAIERAYDWLSKLPEAEREDGLNDIIEQEIEEVGVRVGNVWLNIHQAPPEARERAQAAGDGPELMRRVREQNGDDWKPFVAWLEDIGGELENIAPHTPAAANETEE